MAAIVLMAGLAIWLLTHYGKSPLPEERGDLGSSDRDSRPVPVSYRGSVDVLIHRLDVDGSDIAVPVSDPRALPLRTGDHLKIIAEIKPPSYMYLFWVDQTGAASPLYPWSLGQWGTRPSEEKRVSRLEVKAPNGNWLKVTGEIAGMETVLMLARPKPLTNDEKKLQGWFAALKPQPLCGEKARVWFENFELVENDRTRAPSAHGDLMSIRALLGLQRILGNRIGEEAGFSRAIGFARLGGRKEGK